jgi:hypothetical protein
VEEWDLPLSRIAGSYTNACMHIGINGYQWNMSVDNTLNYMSVSVVF